MGILRGSLPNLLAVINLLRKSESFIDLRNEIVILKNQKPDNTFNVEGDFLGSTKIIYKSNVAIDAKAP
jgi:hypothetical protein